MTATQGDKKITAVTDQQGVYSFPDLTDGMWTIQVEMLGFSAVKDEITIGPETKPSTWELKMLPLDQIHAEAQPIGPPPTPPPPTQPSPTESAPKAADQQKPEPSPSASETEPARDELAQRANDGFLINGSQNNGASSPFSLVPAFGNNRNGGRSLYNGNLGVYLDNSALDASPFSLTGQNTPKPGLQPSHRRSLFRRPAENPAFAQERSKLLCRLSMDAQPQRQYRLRADAHRRSA